MRNDGGHRCARRRRAASLTDAVEDSMTLAPVVSRARLSSRVRRTAGFFAAVLRVSLPPAARAQEAPCTPPGPAVEAVLRRLVAATNVGTVAAIDSAIAALSDSTRQTPERRAAVRAMLGRWHWESTALTPVRECGTENRGYSLLTNAQTGELDSIQVFVVPGSQKIAGFGLVRGARVPLAA